MRASVCILLLTILIVVSCCKDCTKESDDTSPGTDTSWDVSLKDLVAKSRAHVNEHIAKLTKSAEQTEIVQEIDLEETATEKANNRVLVGTVYKKLSEAPEKNLMTDDGTWLKVDAFSAAITAELHSRMPTLVMLPDLEMNYKDMYMCGTGGTISNMQTMKFIRSSCGDVSPEDKTIAAVLTYSFQYLHMTYNHYGSSPFLPIPVTGNLDLGFNYNEVELELNIPNVSVLSRADLNPECLISVKNCKVTRLATPQATIRSGSLYRTAAERMVDTIAKLHEVEFRNLFRMAVVRSFNDLLLPKSKYICISEQFRNNFEIDDKNIMKPQIPVKFESYCGEKATYKMPLKDAKEKNRTGK